MFNLKLNDGREIPLPENKHKAAKFLAATLVNRGYAPGEDVRADWQDFAQRLLARDSVAISHLRPLMQSAIEIVLREPLEPLIQITGLFTTVMAKGLDTRVLAGAIGAVYASDVEEGSAYPEVMFQVGGGLQTVTIGKSGIQMSFTDEALRYTNWDIMAINLRQMRNALIRLKEQKAVAFLREMGTEVFNNLAPATSVFGVLTGRGVDMTANGALTMDDLLKVFTHAADQGYPIDTMLINPQFYMQGIQDPVLRTMFLAHGGGAYFNRWNGNPGPVDPWSNGALGNAGPTRGNRVIPAGNAAGETPSGIAGREHGMTSTPPLPSAYFPWDFRIEVSPFVPFDSTTGLCDIFFLSSGNVGLLLQDEEVIQTEWRDEDKEITKLKLRERYAFHVANEGLGINVMKNVPVRRNYWDGTISASTLDVIAEISATTDLSGVL